MNAKLAATLAAGDDQPYVQLPSPARKTGHTSWSASSSRFPDVGRCLQAYVVNKDSETAISESLPPLPAIKCSRWLGQMRQFLAGLPGQTRVSGDTADLGPQSGWR